MKAESGDASGITPGKIKKGNHLEDASPLVQFNLCRIPPLLEQDPVVFAVETSSYMAGPTS